MDNLPQTIKIYEDMGKPYFYKVEETENYIMYFSIDSKYTTIYNKNTYEIHYVDKEHGSNRFKKDYISPNR